MKAMIQNSQYKQVIKNTLFSIVIRNRVLKNAFTIEPNKYNLYQKHIMLQCI